MLAKKESAKPRRRCRLTDVTAFGRVLKNKHQTVSQGVRRFGKRSIFIDM
jgi:hypothetical protein